jgi:hypothetical protein
MPDLTDEQSAHAKAQAEEYGSFVAVGNILHDGVLAYTAGHPVPKSNVEKYGYEADGLVAKVKRADAAAAQPAEVKAAVDSVKKG